MVKRWAWLAWSMLAVFVVSLIVAHRPINAIGWTFSAIALLACTGQLANEYAIYAYATGTGSLPDTSLAAWYGSWPWFLVLALALVFTPLLFPTGRLLSPRWRPVAWLAGVTTAALTGLTSLRTELEATPVQMIANPIGVAAVGNPEERQQLKWFTYAGALVPLALVSDVLPTPLGDLVLGSPSCSSRSRPASRSCATGSMTSIG